MARRKSASVESVSINVLDLDLDSIIEETESRMEEKAKSHYGFYLPLSDSDALAEKLLSILEQKDIPFATLESIGRKAIAPQADESREEYKVRLDSWVAGLWADIRRGAAFTGRKVSCKEMRDKVGEVLHLYVPAKRTKSEDEKELEGILAD